MAIKLYQVDAFCRDLFSGNPAAVCPLESWPQDTLLQAIAAENNLAETAFYVRDGEGFHIRWFTPTVEVDLCGHATLAGAHVLFEHEGYPGDRIVFKSRSGELVVEKRNGLLQLNFPADTIRPVDVTEVMRSWFSAAPVEAYKGRTDYMLVFEDEATVAGLLPNLTAIAGARDARGIIATARGTDVDFVSRFFAPQCGIDEDPVTGSAHTSLTPYWCGKLGRRELSAIQLSSRRGFLQCRDLGDRVGISGTAKTYLEGRLFLTMFAGL